MLIINVFVTKGAPLEQRPDVIGLQAAQTDLLSCIKRCRHELLPGGNHDLAPRRLLVAEGCQHLGPHLSVVMLLHVPPVPDVIDHQQELVRRDFLLEFLL
uniref:Uncharacterized protein n=1 Tax=Arundo donax TaxID=35708 RepID=A0A0A9SWA2_ARUDO